MKKSEKSIKNVKKKNQSWLKALFLAPSIAVFLVFMVWPVCYNLYLSFFEWNMVSPTKTFVGFKNYTGIVKDGEFLKALSNTAVYVVILLITCFVIPYVVSYVMAFLIKKGTGIYRSLLFFPSLLSLAVAAVVFMWIFNPISGPLSEFFKLFGKESPKWFVTPGYVIFALSIITAWKSFGYNLIVFLAAVVEVPKELIEAAKLEKASNWTIFWSIVRPLTSSTALYVFVITFVFGLQYVFTPIDMITKGGPNQSSTNLVYIIYQYGFTFFQSGRAAAVAIITLVVFLGIVIFQKHLEKKVHYEN